MLELIRKLAYFRPKQLDRKSKFDKAYGVISRKENEDNLISLRHQELVQEKEDKFQILPVHVAKFVYKNF